MMPEPPHIGPDCPDPASQQLGDELLRQLAGVPLAVAGMEARLKLLEKAEDRTSEGLKGVEQALHGLPCLGGDCPARNNSRDWKFWALLVFAGGAGVSTGIQGLLRLL